jgi:hypothetical protein
VLVNPRLARSRDPRRIYSPSRITCVIRYPILALWVTQARASEALVWLGWSCSLRVAVSANPTGLTVLALGVGVCTLGGYAANSQQPTTLALAFSQALPDAGSRQQLRTTGGDW